MNKRNILLILFSLLFTISFTSCEDSISKEKCEDCEDITIYIQGKYITECNKTDTLPAEDASFILLAGKDTLKSDNLDENGFFEVGPIPESGYGINNLVLEASYKGKPYKGKNISLFCCTDTLVFLIDDISCDGVDSISCENIDSTTYERNITSSGECIFKDAKYADLKNNSISIASSKDTRLEFDLSELEELEGQKIFIQGITPKTDNNFVIIDNSQLDLSFNVNTSTIGPIDPITVQIKVRCIDENNNPSSDWKDITIKLSADICDPNDCNCPFGSSDTPKKFLAPNKVVIGTNESSNHEILKLSSTELGDGCLLQIDSIKRADGSDAFEQGSNTWFIETTTPSPLPTRLKTGESLHIKANFEPKEPGEVTEDFEVFTSIYSDADPDNKKNDTTCSFKFKLVGEGCEFVCPKLQVTVANVKQVDLSTGKSTTLSIGQKVEMQDDNYIVQKIKGIMSNDCSKELEKPGIANFTITLPSGEYCSSLQLQVTKNAVGKDDDRNFFYAITSPAIISESGGNSFFSITFLPPDLGDYYNSNHDNTYECAFEVTATDNSGNKCKQEIRIEAEVEEFSLGSSGVVIMQAFSQKSTKSSVPSYHVYDIDKFNEQLNNYGLRDGLTYSFIDFTATPNIPVSPHTLYFDVDSPEDVTNNGSEKPKLYLINTDGNNFSNITSVPVTTQYKSVDAFNKAYEDGTLMEQIMDLNTGTTESFNCTNKRSKFEFSTLGGLDLETYGVYVVWDSSKIADNYPKGTSNQYIYCGMAIIYIADVRSGDDNNMGISSVSFYVEYPVQYEKK